MAYAVTPTTAPNGKSSRSAQTVRDWRSRTMGVRRTNASAGRICASVSAACDANHVSRVAICGGPVWEGCTITMNRRKAAAAATTMLAQKASLSDRDDPRFASCLESRSIMRDTNMYAGAGRFVPPIGIIGIQVFVADVIHAHAVIIASPGFRHNLHVAPGEPAIFGLVVAQQDLHLGNGFHADTKCGVGRTARCRHRDAVDGEIIHRCAVSQNVEISRGAPGQCPSGRADWVHDPRLNRDKRSHRPSINRQLFRLGAGNRAGAFGARRLDRCAFGCNGYPLLYSPQSKG